MFTLAHLSDPHLPMPAARFGQLLNKRVTGYCNWWRHRVHLHVPRTRGRHRQMWIGEVRQREHAGPPPDVADRPIGVC